MAEHRHKRDTNARRTPRASYVAGPIALVATASAVTLGILASHPAGSGTLLAQDSADVGTVAARAAAGPAVSRSDSRLNPVELNKAVDRIQVRAATKATKAAVASAHTKMWTTTDLNLWTDSGEDATQDGEIAAGKQVLVTGRAADDRVEVVVDGAARWVTAGYLSDDKPVAAAAGLSMAPCPDPSVENGLTSNAVYVYRSVCHAFPQITSYGGWDAHGEHSSGRALDIMTSDVALGNAIAAFLQSHSSELHLYDILWRQQIWTPVRASEGWRTFPSRGSATANHYDHVHVSTY
ncbi:mucin-2 protein [Nocardioides sp. CN2-186]|uniref:mucin-2 protein n=1 Tax=Nocardioides tweenelious TaxID=3156607 RepID=UPI0032B58204